MGNKKLRTHELTKATPATQLTPAQRPAAAAAAARRRLAAGGGGEVCTNFVPAARLQAAPTLLCAIVISYLIQLSI
jgi:hypothetical protein